MRGASELCLRTLRAAGTEGATAADLIKAGVANPNSALRTLRGHGHVIDVTKERMGPPFNILIPRYQLAVDATPALFDEGAAA